MLGTAAHEVHEDALKNDVLASSYLGREIIVEDGEGEHYRKETFVVDEEMADAVQQSVDRIRDYFVGYELEGTNPVLYTETRVDISHWTPIHDQSGTSDAFIVSDHAIDVFDYKHGTGVRVYAEKNTQGTLYTLGVLWWLRKKLRVSLLRDLPQKTIRIHIHQPRLDHFDTWEVSLPDLLAFGAWIKARLLLTLAPDPPFVPSEKGCVFCKAKPTCKALAQRAEQLLEGCFEDLTQEEVIVDEERIPTFAIECDPKRYGPQEVAILYRHYKIISDWLNSLHTHVEHLLLQREQVPGFKLVEGRGSRDWIDEKSAIQGMTKVGVPKEKHYTEPILITPPQAEGEIHGRGKKKKLEELKPFWRRIPGKPTVAPESDPRPALTMVDDLFEDLTDGLEF